jgi:hypothetical protein
MMDFAARARAIMALPPVNQTETKATIAAIEAALRDAWNAGAKSGRLRPETAEEAASRYRMRAEEQH